MSESVPYTSSIADSIDTLSHITMRLRVIGTAILALTLLNFGFLLWSLADTIRPGYSEASELNAVPAIVLAITTVIALGAFEALRNRGNALFQELSDELQWHLGRAREEPGQPRERPFLEARVALRTFSASSELPLVPGRSSAAIYAALNLAIAVGAVLAR